ncbi:hypothetical protein [Microviridae sp.]|nr:hypothetical protein [Microviridae sp.]
MTKAKNLEGARKLMIIESFLNVEDATPVIPHLECFIDFSVPITNFLTKTFYPLLNLPTESEYNKIISRYSKINTDSKIMDFREFIYHKLGYVTAYISSSRYSVSHVIEDGNVFTPIDSTYTKMINIHKLYTCTITKSFKLKFAHSPEYKLSDPDHSIILKLTDEFLKTYFLTEGF